MSLIFRILYGIFRGIYRIVTFTGSLLICALFLFMLGIAGMTILYPDDITVADNSLLKLTISGNIVEQHTQEDPYMNYAGMLMGLPDRPRETLLQDILDTIDYAANDPKISAIILDLKYMGGAGLNQLEAIGNALASFKKTGKPVISFADHYSQNQYYLAAHGSSVFLHPMGSVHLHGFGMYRLYFKDALENMKIDFHVFRVGDHKSAIEPLTRNSMSGADRSQTREWLNALWQNYIKTVADQRSLQAGDISRLINGVPENLKAVDGNLARLALDGGLIDGLKTRQEFRSYLKETFKKADEDDPAVVSFSDFRSLVPSSYQSNSDATDQIGIIVASGTITDGPSSPGTIGAETITSLLRDARRNEQVKAVVLRINSGGGSAFASELIRQEILALKKSGKPLLVSMGSMAASGGYWIASDADEIWASANTLTGSIGIFMAFPTFDKLLKSGGIHSDGVGTTNLSAGIDMSQPLSEELQDAIQSVLEDGYSRFISVVADGRKLDREKVEALAHGRVYAGSKARDLGLVDNIGSLDQTIGAAAVKAGLDDYDVVPLLPELSFRAMLVRQLKTAAGAFLPRFELLSPLYEAAQPLASAGQRLLLFPDPNGMYAQCLIDYQ